MWQFWINYGESIGVKLTIRVEASRKVNLISNSGLIEELLNCEHEKGNCEGTVSILCATL